MVFFSTDRTPPNRKHEKFQPPLEDPLSAGKRALNALFDCFQQITAFAEVSFVYYYLFVGPVKQPPLVKPSPIVPEPVKPTKV